MNILHLIHYAGRGGSENYVKQLIKSQSQKHKCFLAYSINDGLIEDLKGVKYTPIQLNMSSPFDISAVINLTKICKSNKIDVIHCHYPRENFIASLVKNKLPKIKIIFTAHLNEPCSDVWKKLNSYASKRDNSVIAVCNSQISLLESNGYENSKIKVIYNGANTNSENRTIYRKKLHDEFKIPDYVPIITNISRFETIKGLPFLIRSFAYFSSIEPIDARLIIVGNGSQFDSINNLIRSLRMERKIICTGFRTDTDNILLGSDIYVNSSESEALSFSLVQAATFGLPCIATSVGGNTDIIDENTGILVEYGDSEALGKAIDILICKDDIREKYSKNILKKAEAKFSFKKMLDDTIKLYK